MRMRMQKMMLVALAAFAALLGGCESGWDVDGTVSTKEVSDRSRSLYILIAEGGPPGTDPGAWEYSLAKSEASLAAGRVGFAYSDLGCAREAAVVAWAPAVKPANEAELQFSHPFRPAPGDYVARSALLHPKCGWWKHPVHASLVLRQER